jgi:hypothetical protein
MSKRAMCRLFYLGALTAAIATCAADASAAPQSNSSRGRSPPLVGSGKDSSGGTMFQVNVFYSTSKTPDCKDKADATISVAPDECVCLYTVLVACVASIKLDTTKGTDGDNNLDASVYIGGSCTGAPIIGGDTEIPCDTCTAASVLSGGIGIEFVCPFGAWGMCSKLGVGIGAPCITATVVLVLGLLICLCCGAKLRSKRTPSQPPFVIIQPQQGYQQGYIQAPPQGGYRQLGSE